MWIRLRMVGDTTNIVHIQPLWAYNTLNPPTTTRPQATRQEDYIPPGQDVDDEDDDVDKETRDLCLLDLFQGRNWRRFSFLPCRDGYRLGISKEFYNLREQLGMFAWPPNYYIIIHVINFCWFLAWIPIFVNGEFAYDVWSWRSCCWAHMEPKKFWPQCLSRWFGDEI